MEPIVAVFGTALLGAIATDSWQQAREAVVGLWHRVHPNEEVNDFSHEVEKLREQVLQARVDGDADVETAIAAVWRLKLHQWLQTDPSLQKEVEQVVEHVLMPLLPKADQARVKNIIMIGSSYGSSKFTQIGQVNKGRS